MSDAQSSAISSDQHTTTAAQRLLSTDHPAGFYWTAGIEVVVFAALGAWLMTRNVGGGVLVVLVGLVVGGMTALPGWWSERHPEAAHMRVTQQRAVRNRLARRHPAYFLVLIPAVAALSADLRWHGRNHSNSILSWVIPAGLGLTAGLAVGAVLVWKAKRARGHAGE